MTAEQQHKQISEDVARALQVAEAAASATSLAALSDTVANLEAGMPAKEDLAAVQGQLATLQNGMTALEDLSNMRAEVQSFCVWPQYMYACSQTHRQDKLEAHTLTRNTTATSHSCLGVHKM